ncbi:MAG: mRNA surveillance protein pelota [Candidatus Nanohalobium sp.]
MELLQENRGDGYIKAEIENQDDLWYLKDIIGEGDKVEALTQRTKLDGREKKTCNLVLEVEKTEYTQNRLRVTGEIAEAVEDVELGYHTFNFEPGTEFELWKDFTDEEWQRLKDAEQKKAYKVLFCLVEKGEAQFYIVKESGIQDLSNVSENIPGKMYPDQDTGGEFYNQVNEVLQRSASKVDNVVLAGPGHEKNKVYNKLSEEVQQKTFLQDTSVTGETGLREAIKRGALEKVVKSSRISEETKEVEKFLDKLREKEGLADYGEKVKEYAELGAVEKLFITAEKRRKNPEIVRKVEQQGGEAVIVHTDHEAGERIQNLGGIAAILRYRP